MRPRQRERLIALGAMVVLMLAVLPNVLWLGHWSVPGLGATAEAAARHDHASHCHGSASCADQAGYGLQWWSEREGTLVLAGGAEREQAPVQAASVSQPPVPPLDPPPRYS